MDGLAQGGRLRLFGSSVEFFQNLPSQIKCYQFFFNIFIGVYLLYSGVLVSAL